MTTEHEGTLSAVDYDPFAEAPALSRVVPTTEPQREVWLASRLAREASLAYNESVSLALRGPLDLRALRAAVQGVVDRHEALRATIGPEGQELFVADSLVLDIPLLDLVPLDAQTREAEHRRVLDEAVQTPFDLERGPLLRACVLRLAADHHVLVLSAHHIVCDGWSFGVLVNELGALYAAAAGHAASPLPPADSFGDYALAQNERSARPEHAADEAFWLERFRGAVPVLDLPTDRPRGARRGFSSQREDHLLDSDLMAQLRKMGARGGASVFSTLLGGFAALLARVSGAEEVVVGVPSAGQSVAGLNHLVGHCVNLLPLRLPVQAGLPLPQLVGSTQGAMLDAFEHPQYTFGTLLKKLALARDPGRLPLVSVMFNLDQALDPDQVGFEGLQAEFHGNPRTQENFELFVNAVQVPQGVRLECQYNTELFDAQTVRRWLAGYESLLRDACARPDTPVGRLQLLTDADRQLLARWNETRVPFRRETPVHALFEEQAARAPEAVALVWGEERWTYRALDARANRIAQALRQSGAEPGTLVGLHVERGPAMLASLLATLKCGAAYVPLDPAYPTERLRHMVDDAGLAVLVTESSLAPVLSFPRERALWLDADEARLQRQPETAPDIGAFDTERPAYVIYTSGSTGKPKGVQVPHRSVVNYLQSVARQPGLARHDRLVAVTTLSFDIAVTELLLPLSVGAQIVLASREQAADGQALRKLVEASNANVMQATPSTWRMLVEAGWQGERGFKALCGGEGMPADLAQQLLDRVGTLWNMYGPTETTVWSTCCELERPLNVITIGRPLANTSVWVLDELGQCCPIGVPGELCIGGDGVTLGYLNRPELTAERFIADPFGWAPGAKLYRTGDRARWRNDGRIEHLGRTDFQVKVRGYRIELGEIEAALLTHPRLSRAVVVTREDRPGDVRLVAYMVGSGGEAPEASELRSHLRVTLPDYMVPQHFVPLSTIPLLPNGKVDRKSLPAPEPAQRSREAVAARNDTERAVLAAFEGALGMPGLGIEDDFFMLGGHSLLATQLTTRLGAAFGVTLPLRTVFEAPTVAQLAQAIAAARDSAEPEAAPQRVQRHENQITAPLTVMQQRLWFLEELEPGRIAYNTPSAHRLVGPLDVAALQRAVEAIVRRQPSLRTSIVREGAEAVQRVHESVRVELPLEDLSALATPQREERLDRRLQELADRHFDLSAPPLFRLHLFRLGTDEHVLFFMPHHIVWDGWSFDLFYDEVAAFYLHETRGTPVELPELAVSYGDYARWHAEWLKGREFAQQLEHWKRRFNGAIDVRPMPTDKPRRAGMSGVGGNSWAQVRPELARALADAGRSANATMFMTLLAVYCVVLHQASGERRLVIGTPVRGRGLPELEPVMGFFTNLLLLQIEVEPTDRFDDLLRRVRSAVLDAFTYPDVPMEQLMRSLHVRRSDSGSLLYHALFSFQDVRQRPRRWGDLQHERVRVFQSGATEDLGCWFIEDEAGLSGGMIYNADVFRLATAELLRDRFLAMLEQVSRDPTLPLQALVAPRAQELANIDEWNSPSAHAPATLPAAHGTLVFGNDVTPADALGRRIAAWSAAVQGLTLAAPARVALLLPMGAERVAALEALLRNGLQPVLLDPASAPDWNRAALAASQPAALVGARAMRALAPSLPALEAAPDTGASLPLGPPSADVVFVRPGPDGRPLTCSWHPADLAEAVQALREVGAGPGTACGLHGVFADDPSLAAWLALSTGADAVTAAVLPEAIAAWEARGVRVVVAPASALGVLADTPRGLEAGRSVLCLGEPMSQLLVQRLLAGGVRVWQGLGLASAGHPVGAFGPVLQADDRASVGRPCAGWRAEVRQAGGAALPIGCLGEIVLVDRQGQEHASGALGRWSSAGMLEWQALLNGAQAWRGIPLWMAPLEAALRELPGVAEVAVTLNDLPAVGRQPMVHVVVAPERDAASVTTAVMIAMAHLLPQRAQPAQVLVLEQLPRLANGDVDTARLCAPQDDADNAQPGFVAPRNATERALIEIWSDLLDLSHISVHDNFFEVGGYSLLAVQLFARIERRFGVNLPLSTLLRHSSCASLAALVSPETAAVNAAAPAADWSPLVTIRKGADRPPLFCVHAIGGNVLNYRVLAGVLSPEQPVYGLQAIGLDGVTRPLASIEAMARLYVSEIRRCQPQGPYYLCGGSLGGLLAYEMACQLTEQGERVALLALFDTAGPTRRARALAARETGASLKRWSRYLLRAVTFTDFKPLLNAAKLRLGSAADRVVARWHWWRGTPVPQSVRWRVVEAANWAAYYSYTERPYGGRITLFRAVDEPGEMAGDPDLGWKTVAAGGVRILEMPGTHFDFIEQPEVAHGLREVLEQAQAQAAGSER